MTEIFRMPSFIETLDGDLIASAEIVSVRYWPPQREGDDHRAQICTARSGVWELYRGPDAKAAQAARDAMKAAILNALSVPIILNPR